MAKLMDLISTQDLKYITFYEALAAIKDVNVDLNLRSKYVELIIGMSVYHNICTPDTILLLLLLLYTWLYNYYYYYYYC